MNDLITLYLVRHGTTLSNEKGILQGRGNSPLTKKGIEVAKKLNQDLSKVDFDLAFASNLHRAKKTAQIILKGRNLMLKTARLLAEKSFGEYEGLPAQVYMNQVYKIYEKLTDDQKFKYKHSKESESNEEVYLRFEKFVKKISSLHPGKTILAVTHGALLRIVLVKLGFAKLKELPVGSIENGAVIKLLTNGKIFKIADTKGVTFKK